MMNSQSQLVYNKTDLPEQVHAVRWLKQTVKFNLLNWKQTTMTHIKEPMLEI